MYRFQERPRQFDSFSVHKNNPTHFLGVSSGEGKKKNQFCKFQSSFNLNGLGNLAEEGTYWLVSMLSKKHLPSEIQDLDFTTVTKGVLQRV